MKTIASSSQPKVVRQLKDNCTESNKEEPLNSITDGERNLQKLVFNGSQRKAEALWKTIQRAVLQAADMCNDAIWVVKGYAAARLQTLQSYCVHCRNSG